MTMSRTVGNVILAASFLFVLFVIFGAMTRQAESQTTILRAYVGAQPTVWTDPQHYCEYLMGPAAGYHPVPTTPRLDKTGKPICKEPFVEKYL